MDEMKTIEGSNCSRYTNLLHSGFHTRIWQKLRDVEDKTKINVSDELLAEYGENIATETELNREPRADVTSEAIAEAEALLENMKKCKDGMHCPHGRPCVAQLNMKQLDKLFGR